MHIILLSGGSGTRLWPLSNEIRSKQFLKLFKTKDGKYESMAQRVYRQIKKVDSNAVITIATSKTQASSIHNQLGQNIGISIEPCRRDTFPAIALTTAYLHDICKIDKNESVVVCPIDAFVNDDYFETLNKLALQVEKDEANLVLMGIHPTYPSDKYGYIIPRTNESVSDVITFKEKPSRDIAQEYLNKGALWNSGVFAFRIKYLLKKAEEVLGTSNYEAIFQHYSDFNNISFDYAVVEKEPLIQVVRYNGEWKDVGTWNTLTEVMTDQVLGEGIQDDTCNNVHILNELDIPIIAMGIKDAVISASPDGILVSDKIQSGYLKKYVQNLDTQVKYAEKSWGVFHVLDVETDSLTIKVTMKANDHMNYHSHEYRDEVWIVVSGQGRTIVDGVERQVGPGDVITIHAGCKHTIFSLTDLVLIEVQIGKNISIGDKKKYKMPERKEE